MRGTWYQHGPVAKQNRARMNSSQCRQALDNVVIQCLDGGHRQIDCTIFQSDLCAVNRQLKLVIAALNAKKDIWRCSDIVGSRNGGKEVTLQDVVRLMARCLDANIAVESSKSKAKNAGHMSCAV
jgi:hypothetical protein